MALSSYPPVTQVIFPHNQHILLQFLFYPGRVKQKLVQYKLK